MHQSSRFSSNIDYRLLKGFCGWGSVPGGRSLWCSPKPIDDKFSDIVDEASWHAKEAFDSLLPFFHGKAPEVFRQASKDGRDGPDQGALEEVRKLVGKEKGSNRHDAIG